MFDWACNCCNTVIDRDLSHCDICYTLKNHTRVENNNQIYMNSRVINDSGWNCLKCGYYSYLSLFKFACKRCNGRRCVQPLNQEEPSTLEEQDGWICIKCDYHQNSENHYCSHCGITKNSSLSDCHKCTICLIGKKDTIFVHDNQIGHLASCFSCAKIIIDMGSSCPICRKNILTINKIHEVSIV